MANRAKEDVRQAKVSVDQGVDVKSTQMLKGSGAFTKAQNEMNKTVPFSTGKAPNPGRLGGESH